jgi:hypothetical protein
MVAGKHLDAGKQGDRAMVDDTNPPERPRVEPEIIPPDRSGRSDRPQSRTQPSWGPYGSTQARGTQRIYVSRIGPFGFAALMLVFAALVAAIFLVIIGAVLIWIPVVAFLVIVAAIYRFFRR